jgi:hypothetical protein
MAYATILRAAQKAADQSRFSQAAKLFYYAGRKAPNARAAYLAFEISYDLSAA